MRDLTIIGGGPAGVAAAVYAARKQLKTLLITESFGGQSTDSTDIQNWIGTPHISGATLAKNLEAHIREYAGEWVEIRDKERVESLQKQANGFRITTNAETYDSKTVLIASGSKRRRLDVPGADEFEHKGVTYCASCDGPIFSGMDTAVIGGGNAGFETAAQLLAYAKSVTLLHRHPEYKADPTTVEKVLSHPNMREITNAEPTEVRGETLVTHLEYRDKESNTIHELPVQGIFVEIGAIPNTTFLGDDLVDMDATGHIVTDPRTQRTSCNGVWAAGDVTDGLYHQNNIAAGDAVRALEDIYLALTTQ